MSGETKKILKKLICAGVITLSLAAGVREAKAATITWHYEDDFSTAKAMSDSYDHTIFVAMPEYYRPALCYWQQMLWFEGLGEPVFLAYAFPFSDMLAQVNCGTFELDVGFYESPFPTYLSYQLSENGVDWTEASALVEGHNQISLLPSNNPSIYIKLFGDRIYIDNLSVTICGPKNPDLYHDCHVDLFDFAVLASQWLQAPGVPSADIAPDSGDGIVDINDLAVLAAHWLDCYVTLARGPYPRDNAIDVNLRPVLEWWSPGDGVLYHDVYFGTNANAVADADRSSIQFMGTVSNTSFDDLYMLEADTTYYWRVDEVGTACTRRGDVWSFTTLIE